MRCKVCGKKNLICAKFCAGCGNPLHGVKYIIYLIGVLSCIAVTVTGLVVIKAIQKSEIEKKQIRQEAKIRKEKEIRRNHYDEILNNAEEIENRKKWFLIGADIQYYQVKEKEVSAHPLVYGELETEPSYSLKCYYKYDNQGRLIESNAGALPQIYAKNDGSYRISKSFSLINRDKFMQRQGKDADYALFAYYGQYHYPDNIDEKNVFLYEHNEDGTVTETVIREGEIKYKNRYRFSNGFLVSQESLDKSTGEVLGANTDYQYKRDYVSYQAGDSTKYWEESYGISGKLERFNIEIEENMSSVSVSGKDQREYFNGKSPSIIKFDYYFDEQVDENGNLAVRRQLYDIWAGQLTGRNLDGSYYRWGKLQSELCNKNISYEYIYCLPEEIEELTKLEYDSHIEAMQIEEVKKEAKKYYGELLEIYKQQEMQGFEQKYPEQINQAFGDLKYFPDGYVNTELSMFYTVADLAEDGIPELLVGYNGSIYDIYGIDNGNIISLIDTGDYYKGADIFFSVCDNNFIKAEKFADGESIMTAYYMVEPTTCEVICLKAIEKRGTNYYVGTFEEGKFIEEKGTSFGEYEKFQNMFEENMKLKWNLLYDYE